MDSRHPLQKAAAFAAGGLVVIWIGGVGGAGACKTAAWLFLGVWPETALYSLAPPPLIRCALTLPRDAMASKILLFLLTTDILTYLLAVPPLLLFPCLLVLLAGQGPGGIHRMAARPFATAGGGPSVRRVDPAFRRDRGLGGSCGGKHSTKRGVGEQGGREGEGEGKMPPAAGRGSPPPGRRRLFASSPPPTPPRRRAAGPRCAE
ncbi:hypothetical protein DFW101_3160 [Solidesulfovibrio carbinoliphilus subsp. oakridgensis]|uniref:Uncharacterized protein n=1 Tax=Solidesulfovibrio carbinoliphilus subsp. oakridgensis TaxID=694327 RepID=G7Q9P4_9BACT|nr:hypothetical protein [Solidesulfovibrio carbinoliphilus]EHJ49160.1 hypothetical protein DFW101_3160 [Solidesulfovibrio carbinoliphilus subsp. oakridgensis]